MKNLLIVESPTKAKTIAHFLESGYAVESSFGHVRDLPKTRLGVDVDHDFAPTYLVPKKAKEHVARLLEKAKKADTIYYATDGDREGEAIAWHISHVLKTHAKEYRIIFHEITKDAIMEALQNPREINQNLVDAQQARRILDRLVGYKLSPLLWKKVARGLSAGRVQSVTVRLIVEREREIRAFKKQEYWTITGIFGKINDAKATEFPAALVEYQAKKLEKFDIPTKEKADELTALLKTVNYEVREVSEREVQKNPLPPYRTSTIQQDAHNRLGFSSKQTMVLAQQLYEGVHLGDRGATGLITYMRTDSTTLANKFIVQAKDYLEQQFGHDYSFTKPRTFKNKAKGAQEAHEAIRPTDITLVPDIIKEHVDPRQYRLYTLIWQRALASLMPSAIMKNTTIDIAGSTGEALFRATGTRIIFDGFLKVYPAKVEEAELPAVAMKEPLRVSDIHPKQHFTEPPPRYNDASLVKELEKRGIGRPSTYAPILETIAERRYVERDEEKRFLPTEMGELVNDLLKKHFPNIVDYNFTAEMEENLDAIAERHVPWTSVIGSFYHPFEEQLKVKYEEIDKTKLVETKTDALCPSCKKHNLIVRMSRFGKFLGCPGYPECTYTKAIADVHKTNVSLEANENHAAPPPTCPNCAIAMVRKDGRFGQFFGCPNYPTCTHTERIEQKINMACHKCGTGEIVIKKTRKGKVFYGCNRYPECTYASWKKP